MARILVVDDEEGVRSFLADALESDGHDVAEAGTIDEALAVVRRTSQHVVVTDSRSSSTRRRGARFRRPRGRGTCASWPMRSSARRF